MDPIVTEAVARLAIAALVGVAISPVVVLVAMAVGKGFERFYRTAFGQWVARRVWQPMVDRVDKFLTW